jgi:high-affinity iron transporter
MRYLWGGVAAGVVLAAGLAAAMLGLQSQLSGEAMEYFQIAMMLAAAGLITQMVFWMRKHGRTLKRDLEAGLEQAAQNANWLGMATVAAIAVGREGAETVIFLYGIGVEQHGVERLQFAMAAAAGLGVALATFWLLVRGGKYLSWRVFFRFSETLLLLLAASLLVGATERMIGLDWLPALADPLWNSAFLLDENGTVGNLVAGLTGYRAHPSLTVALVYLAYWTAVFARMRVGATRIGTA